MKKLFFVVMAVAAISFASCCDKCKKSEGCSCDTCKCEPCECGQCKCDPCECDPCECGQKACATEECDKACEKECHGDKACHKCDSTNVDCKKAE